MVILLIMSSLIKDNDLSIAKSLSISTQKCPRKSKSRTHNLENYYRKLKENKPIHD
jgi:hypothetical protein